MSEQNMEITKGYAELLNNPELNEKLEDTGVDGVYSVTSSADKKVYMANPLLYAKDEYDRYLRTRPENVKILFVASNLASSVLQATTFSRLEEGHSSAEGALKWISTSGPDSWRSKEQTIFWDIMENNFRHSGGFFRHCFLINYCPLVFYKKGTENVKNLNLKELETDFSDVANEIKKGCSAVLEKIIESFEPALIVWIGRYVQESYQLSVPTNITTVTIREPDRECYSAWLKKLSKKDVWKTAVKADKILKVFTSLRDELARILQKTVQKDGSPLKKTEGEIAKISNPLQDAWKLHEKYVMERPACTKILFVGLNPSRNSPTGIPFLSSQSGYRFWKFVKKQFKEEKVFFRHCFVINFCPLIFMKKGGGNVSLSKANGVLVERVMEACGNACKEIIKILKPKLIVGISKQADTWIRECYGTPPDSCKLVKMYHPSPNPKNGTYEDWEKHLKKGLLKDTDWVEAFNEIKIAENIPDDAVNFEPEDSSDEEESDLED